MHALGVDGELGVEAVQSLMGGQTRAGVNKSDACVSIRRKTIGRRHATGWKPGRRRISPIFSNGTTSWACGFLPMGKRRARPPSRRVNFFHPGGNHPVDFADSESGRRIRGPPGKNRSGNLSGLSPRQCGRCGGGMDHGGRMPGVCRFASRGCGNGIPGFSGPFDSRRRRASRSVRLYCPSGAGAIAASPTRAKSLSPGGRGGGWWYLCCAWPRLHQRVVALPGCNVQMFPPAAMARIIGRAGAKADVEDFLRAGVVDTLI